jgi:hypothetical protein
MLPELLADAKDRVDGSNLARGLDNGEILADGPVTEVPLLICVHVQRRGDETLPAPARALP